MGQGPVALHPCPSTIPEHHVSVFKSSECDAARSPIRRTHRSLREWKSEVPEEPEGSSRGRVRMAVPRNAVLQGQRDDLAALTPRKAVPPGRGIPRTPAHTFPASLLSQHRNRARVPRAHRFGVVLKHLPGLLLAAQFLDTLPLQVALLGLLEDLVGAALPGPQELRCLARPQHHGYPDAGGRAKRGGAARERGDSGDTLSIPAPHTPFSQRRDQGCSGGAHARGVGTYGDLLGCGHLRCPCPGEERGLGGGGSLDPAGAAAPAWYSL